MAPGCIAPMCIRVKDHSSVLCEQLQQLRQQTGLVDLDIVCEGHYIKVHKVVMAACSKFFKEQLCKYNVQALVILRLEDFGLELKRDAVNYIIEFIYSGEVNILGEKLTDFCQAAHTLGVAGLEHLPVPATRHGPSNLDKDRIQIADESELCGGNYLQFQQTPSNNENSKLPMEVNPFLNSFPGNSGPSSDDIILLSTIERDEGI
ncbi:broad-complex core protein isoforms 1/2/3/4/5 [Eurytemora carolleeae]|uniref:broad-complex core protein isoforms 1/2/3/4/5 n=1 Tax=Eurytemora carolleeae TaxID=1294199 RepID=UPI000C78BB3C|nr:broad-complex core protein isoforms 1/2/3/4/5 [Eurytemora carolleeae]|eukprot:XP_023344410.1 broad-complex core protein isoforms 1/2/3/4/5-like [Eurytemora affinis]